MLEEHNGDIEFRVVNNDNSRESTIILTGLKNIFQKQLPKMPRDYIARLVYDRTHLSMAIVKRPLEVVGYKPPGGIYKLYALGVLTREPMCLGGSRIDRSREDNLRK